METIIVLSVRQWKRHLRQRSRIIVSLFQPLVFLVALGFGFRPVFEQGHGGDYLQFLTPGIIGMSIMATATASGAELIHDRQIGFIKAALVAPVTRLEIMIGCTIGGACTALIQGMMVSFLGCIIAGFQVSGLLSILVALVVALAIAIVFAAFAMTVATLFDDAQGFHLVMSFLIPPMFLLSGALFPLHGLPAPVMFLVYIDPLTYGVDGLRGALTGIWHISAETDLTVLICLGVFLTITGTVVFLRMQA
jgi:ABC-2 type transport system permease protein